MADYGQAGALAYEIPQRFLQSPGGGAQGSPQSIPNQGSAQPSGGKGDLLAEREQLTDDYYNNYGTLDSYAKDMAKKGINVFEPDYSQPGGGEAFKTFQRMQANVLHSANALKTEFEMEKETRKAEAEGKVRMEPGADRNGLYYSKPENFYSTALSPGVLEANKMLGDQFGTQGEADKANTTVRDQQLFHLKEVKKTLEKEGKSTTQVDNDIHALLTATNINPALAAAFTRASKSGSGAKYDTSIFKKMYNIGSGSWAPGTYTVKPHAGAGAVWEFDELKGDNYGTYRDTSNPEKPVLKEKIIKDLYANPKDHKVYVRFQDSAIPDEAIDDPYHFAREVISNNAKHGDFARTMRAVYDEGMGDEESGGVNPSVVLDPNTMNYQNEMFKQMGEKNKGVEQVQNTQKKLLRELEGGWFAKSQPFATPKGEVDVKKKGKGYSITNGEDFWPDAEPEEYNNLTEDQVIKKLNSLGAYDSKIAIPTAEGKVLVIAPDGKQGHVPQHQLQAALAQGYKLP